MRITTTAKCPGYQSETTFNCQRPPMIGVQIVQLKCSVCESGLTLIMKRGKPGEVKMNVRVALPSDQLRAMLEEEKQFNEAGGEGA